jgi:hypothetical protein
MPDAKAGAAAAPPAVVDVPLPDVCGHFERGPAETSWRRTDTPELERAPDPAAAPAAPAGTGGTGGTGTGTGTHTSGTGTHDAGAPTSP